MILQPGNIVSSCTTVSFGRSSPAVREFEELSVCPTAALFLDLFPESYLGLPCNGKPGNKPETVGSPFGSAIAVSYNPSVFAANIRPLWEATLS